MKARILDDGRLRLWAATDPGGIPDPEEWMQLSAWFEVHFAETETRVLAVRIASEWSLGSIELELADDSQIEKRRHVEDFTARVQRRRREIRRSRSWWRRLGRWLYRKLEQHEPL